MESTLQQQWVSALSERPWNRCQETCLIEAFNLRAAIEYIRKNHGIAVEALSDMPPRREQELDPVTLHNQASSTILRGISSRRTVRSMYILSVCASSNACFRLFCTWIETLRAAFVSWVSSCPTRRSHRKHSAIFFSCTASTATTS